MSPSPPTPVALLGRPATYRRLAHVASALVLGPAWFTLVVTGWSLGIGLAVTLLGIPVLIGLSYATRAAARAERALANGLLDAAIPPRREPARGARPLRALWAWLGDGASWREQAFLMWRFVAGLPIAVGVVAVIAAALGAITAPVYYRWGGGVQFGDGWTVDTLRESLAVVPLGVIVLLLCPWLVDAAAAANRAVARGLLAPPRSERSNWTSGVRPIGRTEADRAAARRRAVAIHAGVVAGIGVVLSAIWALTTPGGYFWPAWPLIALAVPLAIHALVTALQPFGTGARARLRGLWLHAGVVAIVNLYLTAVWALSTPGRYFWVIWTMLALALPVAAHAVWVAAGRGDRAEMAQRIDTLTASRAGAVDAQAAELRRIERDLHDGAQARLVALALDLGMARERLAEAPPRHGHWSRAPTSRPSARSPICATWPAASTRRSSPTAAWPRSSRRSPATARSRSTSTWTRAAGPPRPSRRRPTSSWPRPSPTRPSTAAPRARGCAWRARATSCGWPSATTAPAGPTRRARASPACETGSRRSTARSP